MCIMLSNKKIAAQLLCFIPFGEKNKQKTYPVKFVNVRKKNYLCILIRYY